MTRRGNSSPLVTINVKYTRVYPKIKIIGQGNFQFRTDLYANEPIDSSFCILAKVFFAYRIVSETAVQSVQSVRKIHEQSIWRGALAGAGRQKRCGIQTFFRQ